MLLLLFQFQMTHGNDEVDDLQRKSCVCVVLRPAAGTLFHVQEEEGTAFCLAAGNFLSPPPSLSLSFFPLFLTSKKFQRHEGIQLAG